jgi:hypothetical protein
MSCAVKSWSICVLLPAAVLALLLSADDAQAQRRTQNGQSGQCQRNGGQGGQTGQLRLNALRNALQNNLQQLNALQQSGQLTTAQLQMVSQLQSSLQNALQQVNAFQQNGNLTPAQLQALTQQQTALGLQQRGTQLRGRK